MWTKGIVLLVLTVVMAGWVHPWSTVAEGQATHLSRCDDAR